MTEDFITIELPDANDPTVKHKVRVSTAIMARYGLDLQGAADFVAHQSRAGKRGGSVRNEKKAAACRANLAKGRAKRWERHQQMGVTPEQANRPALATAIESEALPPVPVPASAPTYVLVSTPPSAPVPAPSEGQPRSIYGLHYHEPPSSDLSGLDPDEAVAVQAFLAEANRFTLLHNQARLAETGAIKTAQVPEEPHDE